MPGNRDETVCALYHLGMNRGDLTRNIGRRTAAIGTAFVLAIGAVGCSSDDDKSSGNSSGGSHSSKGGSDSSSATKKNDPFSIDVATSGDILAHPQVVADAKKNAGGSGYDFNPIFANVKPKLSAADLTICHMETPLSIDDTDLSAPAVLSFNVPHEMASAVKNAGFDGCGRANNHMMDRGTKGIASTKKSLEQAGLKQAGPTSTPTDKQTATMYDVKGVKVAQLAYSYTSINQGGPNEKTPPGVPWIKYWQWPIMKASGILADAKRAKQAGADVVILSMHWGTEYQQAPTADQTALANQLLKSPDVDAIFGMHAHIQQPCEKINGKYVLYGLGNFLSHQSAALGSFFKPNTQDGMIADLVFKRDKNGKITQTLTYQPTTVDIFHGHVINLATPTKNADAYKRVTSAVGALGGKCDAKPVS